ncbi:ImmA/IrrE family metallo-endopeptidase [Endozoicomonas acroporae]|uniref:ImmA/IrrE family metallo-endopeptidase n=1 Tax=Endozoicomonas TaxID=305899 RepID=UPI000C75B927|nr:ImmA/IrrE family metallo-endopeptidase [Endozoicomonas acroporae]
MNEAMINPEIVHWARERAGMAPADLAGKLKQKPEKLLEWEQGKSRPSFSQAQKLASHLRVPFGYLFLKEPPEAPLPIPDLRTVGSRVSPELGQNFRDLLNNVLLKQEWFREYQIENGNDKVEFIGRCSLNDDAASVAEDIARTLGVTAALRKGARNWEQYLSLLIERAEAVGILVMRSGIVGSSSNRKLSVEEFRGFAISDDYAPLIFINAADAPAARLFTLVHELAHLWVGNSGISNVPLDDFSERGHQRKEEAFCNRVAAEFLVPGKEFVNDWQAKRSLVENCADLKKVYKVSPMVLARRAYDLGLIPREEYLDFYHAELKKFRNQKGGGGSFNLNLKTRNGVLFSTAVVGAAMEGRLLLRDASRLLNINKISTLNDFAKSLNG